MKIIPDWEPKVSFLILFVSSTGYIVEASLN